MSEDIHEHERRVSMKEFRDFMADVKADIKEIKVCLLGDFEKQGLISETKENKRVLCKHIDDHWKFAGIGVGITTAIVAIATFLNNAFRVGSK